MRAVVFNLSGCPAGWLGAYGNEWVGTPNLDRLAAEAVVFDRHLSDHPHPDGGPLGFMARVNESLRAAVVTTLDAELGGVFEMLRGRGLDQTAAWLLTSDFGYPLGEHGQVGLHRPWLYEELVHLPLVLRLPGAAEAGRRVPATTQPPDLAPTLLDLFG